VKTKCKLLNTYRKARKGNNEAHVLASGFVDVEPVPGEERILQCPWVDSFVCPVKLVERFHLL